MHFWCLLIKVNDFAFDEDAVLWPETTCLDGWVAGWLDFLKIQPSQPPTKAGVGAGAELGNSPDKLGLIYKILSKYVSCYVFKTCCNVISMLWQ